MGRGATIQITHPLPRTVEDEEPAEPEHMGSVVGMTWAAEWFLNLTRENTKMGTPRHIQQKIKWLIDDGYSITAIREALDHAENSPPQHVEPVVPQEEPRVTAVDCIIERIAYMIEVITSHRRPLTNQEGVAYRKGIKAGQEALSLCRKLRIPEVDEPPALTTGDPVAAVIGAMEKKGVVV